MTPLKKHQWIYIKLVRCEGFLTDAYIYSARLPSYFMHNDPNDKFVEIIMKDIRYSF